MEHAVGGQVGVRFSELRLPVLQVQMERRSNDMAGQLVAKLDDVLAKVGFHRGDAGAFQVVVDGDLLADHRFSLRHRPRAGGLADVQYRLARILRRGAPVHLATRGQQLRFPGFQVEIQVGQRVVLDVARGVAQRLELRQRRHRAAAPRHELRPRVGQRLLQRDVGDGARGVALEVGAGGNVHALGDLRGRSLARVAGFASAIAIRAGMSDMA